MVLTSDIGKILEVYKNVNKMLKKRGYNVDESLIDISYENFEKNYLTLEDLNIIVNHKKDHEKYIEVHFLEDIKEDSKVGIKPIRICIDKLKENEHDHLIIITQKGITPAALTNIKSIANSIDIEIFEYRNLEFDITEHENVPKHTLMSPEEKKEFLEKNNFKESQLPKILTTDPVSRFYGFKKSELIRIERISETAGISITYRIVH